MKETEIIAALAEGLARSPLQQNALFASDAEILSLPGCRLAVTVDDYSAEDRLSAGDPVLLGWNLIAATVSDLLAVGAVPRFVLNSFVATRAMDAAYLRALAAGMQQALSACGACMAGGDIGTGAEWRFTGVALGEFPAGQVPLSRQAACGSGAVMVTGTFGDANLAAGTQDPAPRFEVRRAESARLARVEPERAGTAPVACIDTSDGLVRALEIFGTLTPDLRIEIDLDAIPYAAGVDRAAGAMSVPREVFLMGSAGEYELAALVPESAGDELARAGMRRIGTFRLDPPSGLFFRRGSERIAHPGLPDPREAESFDAYCAALVALARRLFHPPGRG
jgi:thiamine-monophosphate kinase